MYNDNREVQPAVSNPNFEIIENIGRYESERAYLKQGSTSTSALPGYISNINNLKMKPEYIIIQPIYSDSYLDRLANAALFDDVINSALERLAYFTLGTSDEIRAVLYPESLRPLKSELEAKNAIKELDVIKSGIDIAGSVVNNHLTDQEIDEFETFIHYTDKNAKLGKFLKKNYRGAHVFARSASYIEYTDKEIPSLRLPAGTPIGLKPLKPMLLGNVAIDPDSWEIQAVEYKDPKVSFKEYVDVGVKSQKKQQQSDNLEPSKYLGAENLLYFVRNNNNMMREQDDFFFGHSTLQSILPLSEESRRLKQVVFPQLNQAHWAGSMLWFFPNWSQSMMDTLFKTVKPGGHTGIPQKDITVQQIQFDHDYAGLINLQNEMKKGILTAFGLPSFLMNFEEVTNRATAQTVVIGFNESTIQAERSWITDILDEQWYSRLFRIFYPNDEFIHIKLKMVTEFKNITFDSFLQKAVAAVSLLEQGMMTRTEVRNMLDLPPLQDSDYRELGLTPPGQDPLLANPQTQPVPGAPNLVGQMMAQRQAQQGRQPTSKTGGGSSQLSQARSELLNDSE